MKKIILTIIVILGLLSGRSFAAKPDTQVDALIKKLVAKGILTETEADQVKGEIVADEKTIRADNLKGDLPQWVQDLKISGDLRLRDQFQRRDLRTSPIFNRNRGRVRARLNVEDQINNKVKVVVGIATDGNSPRSNNETFGGNSTTFDDFGKAGVTVNKGFVVYTPNDKLTLIGGKMDNPVWEPAALLWDPDITPEGGVVQVQKKLNDKVTPFATNGFWVLHDAAPTASLRTQPYVFVSQEGIKGNLTEKAYYKAAVSWYTINNPAHIALSNALGINTSNAVAGGTGLLYNYSAIVGALDVGVNDPFGEALPSFINIPRIGVFGEYVRNPNPSHNKTGWLFGGYMGNSAINGWGTWKLQSYYRVLERDAWLDAFTDDDFYSGDTDTAGYRSQLDVGLAKNVWMTVSVFSTHVFKTFASPTALTQKAHETLIQSDINFKF